MYPKMGKWGQVNEGSIIMETATSRCWKVIRMNATHAGLRDRDGVEKIIARPNDRAGVQIMYLTEDEIMSALREKLNAEVFEEVVKCVDGSQVLILMPWDSLDRKAKISHLENQHNFAWATDYKATPTRELDKMHELVHASMSKGVAHLHYGDPAVENLRRLT